MPEEHSSMFELDKQSCALRLLRTLAIESVQIKACSSVACNAKFHILQGFPFDTYVCLRLFLSFLCVGIFALLITLPFRNHSAHGICRVFHPGGHSKHFHVANTVVCLLSTSPAQARCVCLSYFVDFQRFPRGRRLLILA